ncbi:MAG TPA: aldose epimerase family protein, partial [Calditrichia bacterium]|nr:aldose epimerase family protein [Calditrichia bacterium]
MITKSLFGKLEDGREVYRYRLVNKAGIEMGLIDYGAIMTHLITPDRDGKMGDIVLGYDQLADYVRDTAHLGAIVGRYANRIAGGRFSIGRQRFTLNKNEGNNHLHGGPGGFHKVLWQGEIQKNPRGESVRFSYHSPDGEEGYPGNLILRVTFTLSDLNELHIEYSGETDRTTILNPTHHSYYNLSGNFATSIEGHQIQINADRFTPVNNELIPTGAIE